LKQSGEQSSKSGSQCEPILTEAAEAAEVRADVLLGAGVIVPLEDPGPKADPVRVGIVVHEEEEGAGWGGGVAGSPWWNVEVP
jgi:hypothetical protein